METRDIIFELRNKAGLSQDELAEKVFVTRQAVSRWENGVTTPNTETLKLLSKLFDVSINTLLGSPRQMICQCCGMPLEDSNISKEKDGFFNEDYCKWCYADGEYHQNLFAGLSEVLSQNLWIGLLVSLVAGLLTSFTPCSLSSVPLIIGYVGGYTDNKKRAFFYSLMFCLGMAIVFTALGVVAALVGRLFLGIQMYWYIILGILMLVMALQMWGIINIFPQKCGVSSKSKMKGAIGAFIMGMIGAIFASPCSTPVLIAITAVVSTGQSSWS